MCALRTHMDVLAVLPVPGPNSPCSAAMTPALHAEG